MNYLTLAVTTALLLAGASADRFTPVIGANARIQHFKGQRDAAVIRADTAERVALAHREVARKSERLRREEVAAAQAALSEAAGACEARVAKARRSAAAIQTIVTKEPRLDANRCPLRELVPYGQLRDALAPPAVG